MDEDYKAQISDDWHCNSAGECALTLKTDVENGLAGPEANLRLAQYGPNKLREEKKTPLIVRFLKQFNDFMIWVLLAAVIISGVFLKEYVDAVVIMVIVIFNAVLGFIQEGRAERAMEELKKLSAPMVSVIRDGAEVTVPAEKLVPGDLMVLETGDKISADGRLLTAVNLKTNESSLTGESMAIEKRAAPIDDPGAPVGDRHNMVHAGTHVEYGRGTAIVTATGGHSEMGKIAEMLEEGKPGLTPLQKELRDVGRRIVYICLLACAVVFIVGMVKGNDFVTMLLFSVSLAVAAIPEGLPAIVTITLALGTQTMAKENAIIRSLPAVETLGCANYICSDKTGTLTLNRMTVVEAMLGDERPTPFNEFVKKEKDASPEAFKFAGLVASLCGDARPDKDGNYIGDSTEVALLEAAEGAGFDKGALEERMQRVDEIPFDSDRKMMTTIHKADGGYIVLTKGAAEALVSRCDSFYSGDSEVNLTADGKERILENTVSLGEKALRTIALAYKKLDSLPLEVDSPTIETGLTFVGAYSMMDPPRPEALDALGTCRDASIDVAMITGDHIATAKAVGSELGLFDEHVELVEGRELEDMSEEELAERVENIGVYARVSPKHKVKIVKALQSKGHVVAMTGDGVNDAPALKQADIGVAMGITGTDVSKEASDMVLADDNFATIVTAVREGRVIFGNLKKFIYFLLSCNISEVLTMFAAMIIGFPLPLVAAQILWINLVTDGLPALALGMEPTEGDIMKRPPRLLGENILAPRKQVDLLLQGTLISVGALTAFALSHYWLGYSWNNGQLVMCQTVVFTTMVLSQVFHSLNYRSETRSILKAPPWKNKYLLGAFLISIALQMAVLYVPFMQKAFNTHAPSAQAWALILACALVPVILIDRIKVIRVWLSNRSK
ncbi:MAG: calcium-translocating P-type ATPase, PMCA-type [Actinobacteria bacterium]|nr:calcium-translocating P-type ATPase, PMCA-type [Actinomycetota bacterium]